MKSNFLYDQLFPKFLASGQRTWTSHEYRMSVQLGRVTTEMYLFLEQNDEIVFPDWLTTISCNNYITLRAMTSLCYIFSLCITKSNPFAVSESFKMRKI